MPSPMLNFYIKVILSISSFPDNLLLLSPDRNNIKYGCLSKHSPTFPSPISHLAPFYEFKSRWLGRNSTRVEI